jgi:hypothetical protein
MPRHLCKWSPLPKQLQKQAIYLVGGLLWFLLCGKSCAQLLVRHTQDTLTIASFQYATFATTNGSQCVCNLINSSKSEMVMVAITGADASIRSADSTIFVGIHSLGIQLSLITIANFAGRSICITNVSPDAAMVLIAVVCPDDP